MLTSLKTTLLFCKMPLKGFIGIIPKQPSILSLLIIWSQVRYINCMSYVVISDCFHHDTIAVYTFQKYSINFLRKFLPLHAQLSKIYFSDGAASQYKNRKNLLNYAFIRKTLEFQRSGTSQPHHTVKEHVMVLVEQ